jgi:hypothetical protein
MLFIDKMLKDKLGAAVVWSSFLKLSKFNSAAINTAWTFGTLFLVCRYDNDFSIVFIATPIIFLSLSFR